MEKAKYYECVTYCWECPKCGCFNEDAEEPLYKETVFCEECGEGFEPEAE